jgi:hypothetical protein
MLDVFHRLRRLRLRHFKCKRIQNEILPDIYLKLAKLRQDKTCFSYDFYGLTQKINYFNMRLYQK